MITPGPSSNHFSEPESDQRDDYPDEVLESEWNPIIAEIHSAQYSEADDATPTSAVIDAALARLLRE